MAVLRFLPVALAGLLSACTSFQAYEGPPRPAAEIAEVKGSYRIIPLLFVNFFSNNFLLTVDGKPAKGVTARVLPGPHLISFSSGTAVAIAGYGGGGVFGPTPKRDCALLAVTEAGHRYALPVGSVSVKAEPENGWQTGVVGWTDLAPHRWWSGSGTQPVVCRARPVGFCTDAVPCQSKNGPMRCDQPPGQPIGVCVAASPEPINRGVSGPPGG